MILILIVLTVYLHIFVVQRYVIEIIHVFSLCYIVKSADDTFAKLDAPQNKRILY